MVEYIYYTGFGAKKSGKHTVKEFLQIMNDNFGIECSESLPNSNSPCIDAKKMVRKEMKYNMKHNKPLFEFNRTKKNEKKYKKLINKCVKYRKTAKNKKCNLDEYIKFSGAENWDENNKIV
jgi:hypothetical protein